MHRLAPRKRGFFDGRVNVHADRRPADAQAALNAPCRSWIRMSSSPSQQDAEGLEPAALEFLAVEASVPEPPPEVLIQSPEPAPLASLPSPEDLHQAAGSAQSVSILFLRDLLGRIAALSPASAADLWPVVRILSLALVAGLALRLAGATLGAIDDLPLIGGLLELVGLLSLIRFLASRALHQQKRAELLARIEQLRRDLLG